jgi:hypothetical protein
MGFPAMSRAHARMRSRLGRAGVLDDPSRDLHWRIGRWFRLMARFGTRRRTRKALNMIWRREKLLNRLLEQANDRE